MTTLSLFRQPIVMGRKGKNQSGAATPAVPKEPVKEEIAPIKVEIKVPEVIKVEKVVDIPKSTENGIEEKADGTLKSKRKRNKKKSKQGKNKFGSPIGAKTFFYLLL